MVWGLCSTPWTAMSAWHLKFKQYETLLAVMIQAMTADSQNLKLQVTHISKLDASNLAQWTSSLPPLKVWRRMKRKTRKREVSTGTWAGQELKWLRVILRCWKSTIVLGEQILYICTRGWADHDHDKKRQCACWNHLLWLCLGHCVSAMRFRFN